MKVVLVVAWFVLVVLPSVITMLVPGTDWVWLMVGAFLWIVMLTQMRKRGGVQPQ